MTRSASLLTVTFGWDDQYTAPAVYCVCPRCKGRGKVAPAWTHEGIAVETLQREWSADEINDLLAGAYDVACSQCKGERVVLTLDEENADLYQIAAWRKYQKDIATMEREDALAAKWGW